METAQILVPDRNILSRSEHEGLNLYLGGPFANPYVESICMRLGLAFSRDSMFINGTEYRSIWKKKDYCLVYFDGTNLYIMGTHRYGTRAGLRYVRLSSPFPYQRRA